MHTNIMYKFQSSTCKTVGEKLGAKLFPLTEGRTDVHEQLHIHTNILYKFQSSMCRTVGEKLRTKFGPRTDGRTDREGRTDSHRGYSIPRFTSLWRV